MNTPETRKPLFSQQDFQNAIFLIFSVKSFEGGTSFSSQTTFFMLKSTMKSRRVRFDQMKVSGRGTEPKKTEMIYFQQSIRNFISST